MIADIFLKIPYFFLQWLIGILPASSGFPPEIIDSAVYLGSFMGMFSPLIPIDVMVYTLTLIFTVEIGIFTFKTLRWLFGHIPFIGGKG